MKRLPFLLAYTALALLEFYSETRLPESPTLHCLTKPTLLAALSLYFFRETRGHRTRQDVFFQTALAFAWLGDVLLMLENGFLAGLGAFLVMQVLYTVVFWKRPFR
ncbi:MAG: lysoplasmalogenase, partial [Cytophagaceae bacterium]|nr:lysoplasmalogenase [Cytophagaceae bacterium]